MTWGPTTSLRLRGQIPSMHALNIEAFCGLTRIHGCVEEMTQALRGF